MQLKFRFVKRARSGARERAAVAGGNRIPNAAMMQPSEAPLGNDAANHLDGGAHRLLAPGQPFAVSGQSIEAIEPDLEQDWPYQQSGLSGPAISAAGDKKEFCAFDEQDETGGKVKGSGVAWNFAEDFSELAKARAEVGTKLRKIIIAHLDTGFDPKHVTLPPR